VTSILLVSLDTLRADVAYSGKFATINRLLSRGSSFQTAVAAAPLTPPSHASVLSGLYPPRHGLRHLFKEQINDDVTMLAEYLQRSGYRTGAITSCPGLNRWYQFDRGFSHFDDEIPLLADGTDPLQTVDVKLRGTALKRANIVVDRAIEWISREPSAEFFLFVHFFDSHWPYEPPAEFGAVDIANAYEGEVAFMDHHLGRLLDWLEAQGLADDLIIVLFSDHGEDLGGWYPNDKAGGRGYPEEEGHGALLFDTTLLVALSVSWPGQVPARRSYPNQVRLVDITPTILDLSGYPEPEGLDGKTLRPIWEGREFGHRPAYFETFYREELAASRPEFRDARPLVGVRLDDRWKLLWEPVNSAAKLTLLNVEADPGEWTPLVAMAPRSPPPPIFDPFPPNQIAISQVLQTAGNAGLKLDPIESLLRRLLERPELGITVRGSLYEGGADRWSDIDIELQFPCRAPDDRDHAWVHEQIAATGKILTWFPATHFNMPDLLIFFVDSAGDLLKFDINCIGPGAPREKKGGYTVRIASGMMPTVRCNAPAPLDIPLSWRRLAGWSWYCQTKICRGEFYEALDSLNTIRNEVLIPALHSRHELPREGSRRLESRLPESARSALDRTVPRGIDRNALQQALDASLELGRLYLQELAVSRQITLDLTSFDAIAWQVRRAAGAFSIEGNSNG
jgi:arylsulfatase